MGFQNIGCPADEYSEEAIKNYLKIYFPQWLTTYNFEDYSNHIFNAETNKSKVNLDLLRSDQQQYLFEKKKANNNFITTELLNLGHFIEWIEEAFKIISETSHHPDFFRYKKWFETKDERNTYSNQDFLSDLKNKKRLSEPQFEDIIYNKIDSLSKHESMYFLTLMYLDFVKIQEFLQTKFEPLPKKKKQKEIIKLSDFFPKVKEEKIEAIQLEFKNLKIGKQMAILIYLLSKKYNLLFIDDNDRKKGSRLHFVRTFTDKKLGDIKAIGNYLEGTTGELKKIRTDDKAYIDISKRLEKIVSNG